MQDAGLVEWRVIHRPTAGPDFFQFIVAYGGEYADPATGKLVLDRQRGAEDAAVVRHADRTGV